MIKAVLFDFDGVLTIDATGSESICNYICKKTDMNKEVFWKEYRKYNDDLLYGRITHEEIWDKICKAINKNISIEVLNESFVNTPINNEMIDLVRKIRNKNYKTAMVTDNKKDRIDIIVEYYNFNNLFDDIVVSAEIGSGKEDDKIFLETIHRLKVEAEECVFIDNQEKNLAVPKKLGMQTIFYNHEEKNVLKLVKELEKLGVSM